MRKYTLWWFISNKNSQSCYTFSAQELNITFGDDFITGTDGTKILFVLKKEDLISILEDIDGI